jgi:hypothetical protein
MNIKRKTRRIRSWEEHLFHDISSTNIDTLVPLLYQCVETRSMEAFFNTVPATSAPPFEPLVISETFATSCEPLYATNTSHHKQETFIYEYPLH